MIRNVKALGPVLAAVLVISGLVAQMAQAEFEWSSEATKFRTKADPTAPNQTFSITGGTLTFTCNQVNASGFLPAGTTGPVLETSEITYNNTGVGSGNEDKCASNFGSTPKFEQNFCDHILTSGETIGSSEITGTLDIFCAGDITINAGVACIVHIPIQVGLKHVLFRTEPTTPETITGEATVTKIIYTHTGLCGSGTHEDGTYSGKFTITAESNAGMQKSITVT